MRALGSVGVTLLTATVLTVLLASRGFTHFTAVRVKVDASSQAAADGIVRVTTDDKRVGRLPVPFAVVLRLHNGTSTTQTFSIAIDGQPACDLTLPADSSPPADAPRHDCVMTHPIGVGPGHEVVVRGPPGNWSLEYLEFSTHHGATSGGLFIVPLASPAYARPGAVLLAIFWAVICGVALLPRRAPRMVTVASVVLAIAASVVIVGVAIAPWVSPYRVVLSTGTVAQLAMAFVVPQLWTLGTWIARRASALSTLVRPIAGALIVSAIVLWAYGTVMERRLHDVFGGNYSGLLIIARDTFDRNPLFAGRDDVRQSLVLQDGGYDGQFMYFATFDPFLRRFHDQPSMYGRVMDAPPYRFGRIGFSLLTKIVSLDHWPWYPATLVWLILAGIAASAFVIALIARDAGASPAWGLLAIVIPGFWMSIESGLPEPIAAAALLTGYWLLMRGRWLPAAGLFAGSLLVRETGVVLILAVAIAMFRSGSRQRAVAMTTLALAPIVLWRVYVGWTLFPDWHWQGFFFNPHDLGVPFMGFVDLWRTVARGEYLRDLHRAAFMYPILLISALVLSVVLAVRRPGAITLATIFYATVAVSLNYASIWVHVGNGQRGTFEVFTWLAVTSAGLAHAPRLERVLAWSFWIFAAAYVFYGSFEAAFVRGALF